MPPRPNTVFYALNLRIRDTGFLLNWIQATCVENSGMLDTSIRISSVLLVSVYWITEIGQYAIDELR